jgi:hypothetical protein
LHPRRHPGLDGRRNRAEQRFAVGEVPIRRVRRNSNSPSRFPDGQRFRPTGPGELKAGVDQCRAQISVVVTGLRVNQPLTLLWAEVYGVNITNVDRVNIATEDFS